MTLTPRERRLAGLEYKRSAAVPIPARQEAPAPESARRTRLRRIGRAKAEMEDAIFGPQAEACRALSCYVCGANGSPANPIDPHHEPPVEKGGRDADTLPLCRYGCHLRRHETTAEAFWAAARLDPQAAQESVRGWMEDGCPDGMVWAHITHHTEG